LPSAAAAFGGLTILCFKRHAPRSPHRRMPRVSHGNRASRRAPRSRPHPPSESRRQARAVGPRAALWSVQPDSRSVPNKHCRGSAGDLLDQGAWPPARRRQHRHRRLDVARSPETLRADGELSPPDRVADALPPRTRPRGHPCASRPSIPRASACAGAPGIGPRQSPQRRAFRNHR